MGEKVTKCGFCDGGIYWDDICPYCDGTGVAPQLEAKVTDPIAAASGPSELVLDLRETLVSIAITRQDQADSWPDLRWDDPAFDWKMCAQKMEKIARDALDRLDPILRMEWAARDDGGQEGESDGVG